MSKETWDNVWENLDLSLDVINESDTRWKKIKKCILNDFGSFENLNTIELGSGIGDFSLKMSLEGANVTLIDYNKTALQKAQERFEAHRQQAEFIQTDIFDLSDEVKNKFDISMSFGLVEHFEGELREKVIKIHYSVLKNNGLTFISVPNKYCIPYRIWRSNLEIDGTWGYGLEIPFSREELFELSEKVGFKSSEIFGSSFLDDMNRFLLDKKLTEVFESLEIDSVWDDYLGYAIVLAAKK